MLSGGRGRRFESSHSDQIFQKLRAKFPNRLALADHPLGAKGAGEGGIVPLGGVIANAVAAALASFNAEPRALPLSPMRVWELIHRD
jgi:CO/xanthine dehydrogenase Mo-binding subunit